ncbi:acetyltransferase (GNAT) family protein [Desulfobotulus alkaliphilus]|uniref:Acetyltransferase (GNAT) family protein n=1 Tax=Desulfobotulus alkaliphilus TaxID=622671 RepID=A0A562RPK9_9BACT|nr:GNAT family N-acetyltransferase [Desulfobotulus alkaliphilus]TWI70306.1 acetyltransferase (GNAT) family protein [Desulfobotulus alkaliphilus]
MTFPLHFRRAEASPEDALFFAQALNMASDGLLHFLFGSGYGDIIAQTSMVSGHDLSLEHVLLAECEGEPVAMLSGMAVASMADFSPVLRRAAGRQIWRAGLLALTALPLFKAMSIHNPNDWYLQAIAVSEKLRGTGTGSKLLAMAEERAISCGAHRITLDVSSANAAALRLYQRMGYGQESISSAALLLGGLRVRRMVKTLLLA